MHRTLYTIIGLVAVASGAQAGALEYFTETTKDFGTTPRGPVLVHYFTVKNTSNQTVSLGQPRVSCGCVSASVVGKNQIAPGETTAVVAQMDTRRIPQANVLKSVIVYVPFVSPFLEEVQLRVQAIARDDLVLTPDTLSFGTVRKGQPAKVSTKVTFYSDPSWQMHDASSTGVYVKATTKEVARKGNEVSYEVTAELDTACPVGNWTADVWVKTSALGLEKLRIPVSVNVVAPIAINPEGVKFGEIKVGEKSEQKVILQGSQPFKVLKIKGAEGEIDVAPVAEGARPVHILKLSLNPKTAGDFSKSVEIVTDHAEQPTVVVPLTAKVVKP